MPVGTGVNTYRTPASVWLDTCSLRNCTTWLQVYCECFKQGLGPMLRGACFETPRFSLVPTLAECLALSHSQVFFFFFFLEHSIRSVWTQQELLYHMATLVPLPCYRTYSQRETEILKDCFELLRKKEALKDAYFSRVTRHISGLSSKGQGSTHS